MVLNRPQAHANRGCPESKCSSRANWLTISMVFSLRHFQKKCREPRKLLYFALLDLKKSFNLMSKDDLLKILSKVSCQPTLLSVVKSFHNDMKGTIAFEGMTSEALNIHSGVRQGCMLSPTLFGIFFTLLKHAFAQSSEGIYLHAISDGKLWNLSRLKDNTKVCEASLRSFLFADDAVVATHDENSLLYLGNDSPKHTGTLGWQFSVKNANIMQVYKACMVSTILCTSDTWTLWAYKERRHHVFYMNSLHYILNISWKDKVPNKEVLSSAGVPSMATLLRQRCLHWLGHVCHMEDAEFPRISFIVSLHHENDHQGIHSCTSRTYASGT